MKKNKRNARFVENSFKVATTATAHVAEKLFALLISICTLCK